MSAGSQPIDNVGSCGSDEREGHCQYQPRSLIPLKRLDAALTSQLTGFHVKFPPKSIDSRCGHRKGGLAADLCSRDLLWLTIVVFDLFYPHNANFKHSESLCTINQQSKSTSNMPITATKIVTFFRGLSSLRNQHTFFAFQSRYSRQNFLNLSKILGWTPYPYDFHSHIGFLLFQCFHNSSMTY